LCKSRYCRAHAMALDCPRHRRARAPGERRARERDAEITDLRVAWCCHIHIYNIHTHTQTQTHTDSQTHTHTHTHTHRRHRVTRGRRIRTPRAACASGCHTQPGRKRGGGGGERMRCTHSVPGSPAGYASLQPSLCVCRECGLQSHATPLGPAQQQQQRHALPLPSVWQALRHVTCT
jgi:hypothetical protein